MSSSSVHEEQSNALPAILVLLYLVPLTLAVLELKAAPERFRYLNVDSLNRRLVAFEAKCLEVVIIHVQRECLKSNRLNHGTNAPRSTHSHSLNPKYLLGY